MLAKNTLMQRFQAFSHLSMLDHGRLDHPENRNRLDTFLSAIQTSPFLPFLELNTYRLAQPEELLLNHTKEYIERVLSFDEKEGNLDPETPLTSGSVKAARLAAGLGLELVERVIRGQIKRGFLIGRPPGHHSRPSSSMGFCVFNNIALAAHIALQQGLQRIVILDWDVHHGNGTQESFYQDDRVLFIDLHQENLFPVQSGLLEQKGEGKGYGYTVNLPLPHSCRDIDYLYVMDQFVAPLIQRYRPELILVSAGYDAHETDPLGSMYLTTSGFGLLTQRIRKLADDLCEGRLLFFLEGGYDPNALSQNILECISYLAKENCPDFHPQMRAHHDEVVELIMKEKLVC